MNGIAVLNKQWLELRACVLGVSICVRAEEGTEPLSTPQMLSEGWILS